MVTTSGIAYDGKRAQAFFLEWIISDSLSLPFALICLYLTGSQIAFLIKKGLDKRKANVTAGRSYSGKRSTNARQVNAITITIMCIIAAFSAAVTIGFDFTLFLGQNDYGCELTRKFVVTAQGINSIAVYSALWLRQRVFYQDPKLNHLSSKFVRILSWSIVLIFITASFCCLGFSLFLVRYIGTPYGCINPDTRVTVFNLLILQLVSTMFFQVIFLALFIYPLLKHHQSMKAANTEQGRNPVIKIVKRVIIITIICVVTDVMCIFIVYFLDKTTRLRFTLSINVFINVISVILSFSDWKMRVMPWRMKEDKS